MIHEPELEIALLDEHDNVVQVTGRFGTALIAVVAKTRHQFGTAEARLLTYLAVLRKLRINVQKQNRVIRGAIQTAGGTCSPLSMASRCRMCAISADWSSAGWCLITSWV